MSRLTLIILVFLVGCAPSEPKYGHWFNDKRREIGLPILPKGWTLQSIKSIGLESWHDKKNAFPNDAPTIPYRFAKYVIYPGGKLLIEEDVYKGENYYKTIDGTFRETLAIRYIFRDSNNYGGIDLRVGWSCSLDNQETAIGFSEKRKISLDSAIKVLQEWQIDTWKEYPSITNDQGKDNRPAIGKRNVTI